jgi:hypothetical protein
MARWDWKPASLAIQDDGQALIRRYSNMQSDRYVILAMEPGARTPKGIKADYTLTKYRTEAAVWNADKVDTIIEQLKQRNVGWRFSKCPDYWVNSRDVRAVDLGGIEFFDSKAPPEDANWTVYVRHAHESDNPRKSGSIGFISGEGKGIVRFSDMIRFTSDEIDAVVIYIRTLNPQYLIDKYYINQERTSGIKSTSERLVGLSPIVPTWLYKYPIGRQSFPGDTFLIECRPTGAVTFRPAYLTSRGFREIHPLKATWFGYQAVRLDELMPFLFQNNPGWVFRLRSVVHYQRENSDLLREVGVFSGKFQGRKRKGVE